MAADVAGYSRLVGVDEEATLGALRACRKDLIDPLIREHGGRVANTAGDSLLLEFTSVVDAVRCSVAFQKGIAERNKDIAEGRRIRFRVGINLGDVVADGDDLLGDGVNVAARLEGLSDPGEITLSDEAYRQVRDRLDLAWQDGGEHQVKNIARPVHIWRWAPSDQASSAAQSAPAVSLQLPDKPSIAVLPFTNMSGDPEQEYFADGIAEDIITALSRIHWFFVTARNSSFTYKGQAVDVQQVGRQLGVRYILEGSVRKSGQRLRVTAQLIDATTDKHVWAEKYDRELSDIFEVQDEITRNVVAATLTQVQLSEGSLFEDLQKPSLPVWVLANRSWKLVYEMTAESLSEAKRLAEEAIALDPGSGRAHQALAVALWHLAWMGFVEDAPTILVQGRRMAERAVRLNDNDEYSHWILGLLQMADGEFDKAIAELRRAIEINPNCSLAYGSLATVLNHAGQPGEAIINNETAIRSNPRDPSIFYRYNGLALSYFLLNQFEIAVDWARKSVQHKPSWFQAHAVLIASLVELGRLDDAQVALSDYLAQIPSASLIDIQKLPFRIPAHREQLVDALRKAGLPE
ncbi:MAG TPA: tetratricopeptide repeat protein [Geminicoccaceae bacterium]